MKRHILSLAAVVLVAALTSPAFAGGNLNFTLGQRNLSDSNWDQWDTQGVFGATVDFEVKDWPVELEGGLQGSNVTKSVFGTDVKAEVHEIFFGANKTWNLKKGKMHPFAGAGIADVTAKFSGGGLSDSDSSTGVYLHGGIFWRLGHRFNIGFDGRVMLGTNITLNGASGDSNYTQLGVLLGFGWPKSK
jgi:outer membrane protein with beta-barrel domain